MRAIHAPSGLVTRVASTARRVRHGPARLRRVASTFAGGAEPSVGTVNVSVFVLLSLSTRVVTEKRTVFPSGEICGLVIVRTR